MNRESAAAVLFLVCFAALSLSAASLSTTQARADATGLLASDRAKTWISTHAPDLRREHPHLSDRAIIQMAERERELALDTALARHQRDTDAPGAAPELSTPDERLELPVRGTVSPDRADRLPARRR